MALKLGQHYPWNLKTPVLTPPSHQCDVTRQTSSKSMIKAICLHRYIDTFELRDTMNDIMSLIVIYINYCDRNRLLCLRQAYSAITSMKHNLNNMSNLNFILNLNICYIAPTKVINIIWW